MYRKAVCSKCPFRRDADYLRPERKREIQEALYRGETFFCHETVTYEEDDDGETVRVASRKELACAGAVLVLANEGLSMQVQRIDERVRGKEWEVAPAPVFDSLRDFARQEGVEVEPCSVVEARCTAPAGMMVGGGIVEGTEGAEFACSGCGEPVCGECSRVVSGSRFCVYCADEMEEGA